MKDTKHTQTVAVDTMTGAFQKAWEDGKRLLADNERLREANAELVAALETTVLILKNLGQQEFHYAWATTLIETAKANQH